MPTRHAYGVHDSQFGELYQPEHTAHSDVDSGSDSGAHSGVVVLIHGGFWRARWDLRLGRAIARDLCARGYLVWNLEYRRVGEGGGWAATFDDVAAGIDHLATLDVDHSCVVAIGHSAGGHLATWAAGRSALGQQPRVELTAVIAQAGVLNLRDAVRDGVGDGAVRDLLDGWPADVPERYAFADPSAVLPVTAEVICLHGRSDDSVPFSLSEGYVRDATAAGGRASLIETPGGHMELIDTRTPDWAVVPPLVARLLAQ